MLFSILFSTLFSVAVHTQAAAKKCVYVYLKMIKPLFFFFKLKIKNLVKHQMNVSC